METRKIMIVDSSSNQKVVVNTDATTFGELKKAARAAGINYEGKDWLEGITKTSPVGDDSQLPTNVQFKGATTNNLVYMLTNTNKKIRSGGDRKSLYEEIKKHNLAEKIKEAFGRNYTQIGNAVLQDFIAKATAVKNEVIEKVASKKAKEPKVDYKDKYEKTVEALAKFIAVLPDGVLEEAKAISETLASNVVEEVDFSEEDINSLFKD